MGKTDYSDKFYADRAALRAASGEETFAYSATTKATKAPSEYVVHGKLNPKGLKLRESCDSEEHPTSKPVSVSFDVTGSMGSIPMVFQKKLNSLMGLLIKKGYLMHPQVQINAVGDATTDRAPLQVGQFESGNELEDDLTNILLEGNGGSFGQESYELALYMLARHTTIDCWNKRGEKGYAFLIGDERAYPSVKGHEVAKLFGGQAIDDIPIKQIVEEVQTRYHLFMIIPSSASGGHDAGIKKFWVDLLGAQHVIILDDADNVCETVALTIGIMEGMVDDAAEGEEHLIEMGIDDRTAKSVSTALATIAKSELGKPASIGTLATPTGKGGVTRL